MEISTIRTLAGTPFTIEYTSVETDINMWNSSKITIFRDGTHIGAYIRNYPTQSLDTFYPFVVDNTWYALYSSNYISSRIMKLHNDSIEDWCAIPSANGFCPNEFYIPRYSKVVNTTDDVSYIADSDYTTYAEFKEAYTAGGCADVKYCEFGFLSGHIWGDDEYMKIKYIDLTHVAKKRVKVVDKFAQFELPALHKLKQCVSMRNWSPESEWIDIVRVEHVNVSHNIKA